MSKQRRWLWPCSESILLRQSHYQNVTFDSLPMPNQESDVLLSGSDDELDPDEHRTKKRRIELLAKSYLSGDALFIQSATLKGPFTARRSRTKDKYANYVVGSPLLPEHEPEPVTRPAPSKRLAPYVPARPQLAKTKKRVRVDERLAMPPPVHVSSFFEDRRNPPRGTPESSDTAPGPPRSSSPNHSLVKSVRRSLPPSPLLEKTERQHRISEGNPNDDTSTKILARPWPLLPREADPDSVPNLSTKSRRSRDPSLSPSPSRRDVPKALEALHLNPRSSLAPTGFTPINQSSTSVTSAAHNDTLPQSLSHSAGKLPKLGRSRQKKTRYLEVAQTCDNSPLMFRRKNEPLLKIATSSDKKRANGAHCERNTDKPSARKVLLGSSVNVPTQSPKSLKQNASSESVSVTRPIESFKPSTDNIAPAIDMSFDQGSLAVNFDFIDRHTNNILPVAENVSRRGSTSEHLRRLMRLSGASIIASPMSPERSETSDTARPHYRHMHTDISHTGSRSLSPNRGLAAEQQCGESSSRVEAAEIEAAAREILPVVSTQAAIEEAHRGLFDDSSPIKPRGRSQAVTQATPGSQLSDNSARNVTITPFHEFNAKIAAETGTAIQSSLPNTQAMFDNLSPFLSPDEPRKVALKKQKATKRTSFAPILEESADMSILLSPEKPRSLAELQTRSILGSIAPEMATVEAEDKTISRLSTDSFSLSEDEVENGSSSNQAEKPIKNGDTEVDVLHNPSPSPDIIFSQRSGSPANQRDPLLGPQEQSVHLTDVFDVVRSSHSSRIASINVGENLSNTLTQSSRRKPRSSDSSSRKSREKDRTPGRPSSRSTRESRPGESLSQPQTARPHTHRFRDSLSQPIRPASSSNRDVKSTGSQLTGSTTIADDAVARLEPDSTAADVHSSNVFGRSLPSHTPLDQARTPMSAPPTSSRNKTSLGAAPSSSYQAAQRMDNVDLDSTLDSITQAVLSPWDVETAMRRPLDVSMV